MNPEDPEHTRNRQAPGTPRETPGRDDQIPGKGRRSHGKDRRTLAHGRRNPVKHRRTPVHGRRNPVHGRRNPVKHRRSPVKHDRETRGAGDKRVGRAGYGIWDAKPAKDARVRRGGGTRGRPSPARSTNHRRRSLHDDRKAIKHRRTRLHDDREALKHHRRRLHDDRKIIKRRRTWLHDDRESRGAGDKRVGPWRRGLSMHRGEARQHRGGGAAAPTLTNSRSRPRRSER